MPEISNTKLLETRVERCFTLSGLEGERVGRSLAENGVAVIKGFIDEKTLISLKSDAVNCTKDGFDAGMAYGAVIKGRVSCATADFSHPFLVSKSAVKIVTSRALVDVVEGYLKDAAIIHHGLFQKSFSIPQPAVDWHVDMGSNKNLNSTQKFADVRLRMIIYLTDVKTGGLSYILDSRDAAKNFLKLPAGELYPQNSVPQGVDRKITLNEPMGTIILFDAHGLHRPEAPKEERIVLNVWFARSDFSASLPPVLVSMNNIDSSSFEKAYIFKNERGAQLVMADLNSNLPNSFPRKIAKRIYQWLKK